MKVLAVIGLVVLLVLGNLVLASPGRGDVLYDKYSGARGRQSRYGAPGMDVDTLQAIWNPAAAEDGGPIVSSAAGTFAMIPIPASILLLGSGLLGLGLIGWRRKS